LGVGHAWATSKIEQRYGNYINGLVGRFESCRRTRMQSFLPWEALKFQRLPINYARSLCRLYR